jgi:RNA polymerase sigma factor (sigma-70 family)
MGTIAIVIDKTPSLDFGCGDKKGQQIDAVLSRCLPSLYRRAFRYLGNAADAEDAVQDALLSAYKNLEHFRGDAQMSTWLTAIVTNSALTQCAGGHAGRTFRWMSCLETRKVTCCRSACGIEGQARKKSFAERSM